MAVNKRKDKRVPADRLKSVRPVQPVQPDPSFPPPPLAAPRQTVFHPPPLPPPIVAPMFYHDPLMTFRTRPSPNQHQGYLNSPSSDHYALPDQVRRQEQSITPPSQQLDPNRGNIFEFPTPSFQSPPHDFSVGFFSPPPPPLTHFDNIAIPSPHHDTVEDLFPDLGGHFTLLAHPDPTTCSSTPQQRTPLQAQFVPLYTSPPSSSSKDQEQPADLKSPSLSGAPTSSASEAKLATDHVLVAAVTSSPSTEHGPEGRYIPPSTPDRGGLGFEVQFSKEAESGVGNGPVTFCRDSKTLFARPCSEFAVTFKFATPPPPGCLVRALVCYKEPIHIKNRGPITRCLKHLAEEKDSEVATYFIRSKSSAVKYGELYEHKCVTIPIETMSVIEEGAMAVFSYSVCYTSCIVGNGRKKPAILTIFSLISNTGTEIARDSFTVRVCACPHRDRDKLLAAPSSHEPRRRKVSEREKDDAEVPPTKARATSGPPVPTNPFGIALPMPPHLDLTGQAQPNEEGNYTFHWELRDLETFNLLNVLKAGYLAKERSNRSQ